MQFLPKYFNTKDVSQGLLKWTIVTAPKDLASWSLFYMQLANSQASPRGGVLSTKGSLCRDRSVETSPAAGRGRAVGLSDGLPLAAGQCWTNVINVTLLHGVLSSI